MSEGFGLFSGGLWIKLFIGLEFEYWM